MFQVTIDTRTTATRFTVHRAAAIISRRMVDITALRGHRMAVGMVDITRRIVIMGPIYKRDPNRLTWVT
jgi:hypothetical protein